MDVVVCIEVNEAVLIILVILVTLSTTTVKQLFLFCICFPSDCFTLFLVPSMLSASKCPNSSLKFASIGLKSISTLFGIFFPVPS